MKLPSYKKAQLNQQNDFVKPTPLYSTSCLLPNSYYMLKWQSV